MAGEDQVEDDGRHSEGKASGAWPREAPLELKHELKLPLRSLSSCSGLLLRRAEECGQCALDT